MTKTEYKYARKMIRENGRSALRHLSNKVWQQMDVLLSIQDSKDALQERMEIVKWCRTTNTFYTFKHLK